MKKPQFLYHASHNTNITELEPRNEFPRYQNEGNAVFATHHLALAAMFLAPRNISTEISIFGEKYVIFINATENEYSLADHGGAIYTVSSDTFEVNPNVGMGENEWTSKLAVHPISKKLFATSIDAMNLYNVDRHFVNDATMQRIQADPSNALKFVT